MTTYVEEGRIVVKANSPIKGIADLNGKTVATTTGTTSVQTLRKNKKAANMDFKEVFGKDHADSFLLLESGRADAFVMDGQILAGLVSKSKNPPTTRSRRSAVGRAHRLHDAQGRSGVQEGVDASIQKMVKSGDLGEAVRQVVRGGDPAGQHQGRPAAVRRDQERVEHPNDKPMEDYATP
jgi:glutamate/aspartate transport system substrate-binding protein